MNKSRRLKTDSVLSPQSSVLTISASEIGEYEYCARAWWYKHVVKLAPPQAAEAGGRFARGKLAHARHGRGVQRAALLRTVGLILALCGALALLIALVIALLPGS